MKIKTSFAVIGTVMILGSAAQAATVDGFRNAKFGADENTVQQAAIKDLHISDTDIQKIKDPTSGVTVLSAKMKKFDPLGLPATVNYVMGSKCNCLTQVSVQWDFPKSATAQERSAAMTGVAALVGRFESENWGKDETVLNRVPGEVKDGSENVIVFFRGENQQGNAVTLAGGPVKMAKDKTKDNAMTANVDDLKAVSLVYERDTKNPDVNKVDISGF